MATTPSTANSVKDLGIFIVPFPPNANIPAKHSRIYDPFARLCKVDILLRPLA